MFVRLNSHRSGDPGVPVSIFLAAEIAILQVNSILLYIQL